MKPLEEQLEIAWREVAVRAGVPESEAGAIFDDLRSRYSEPNRHYHNLTHIAQMLDIIEQFQDQIHDYVAVCLAVWFHDVIYDTQRKDNEEQSAAYAFAVLTPQGVGNVMGTRVQLIIIATKMHQSLPGDTDCQLLLDADLAILSASPSDYDQYAQAIRQEYAWVSEYAYRLGRAQVLQGFLQRDRLYHIEPLFQTWEQPARRNLQREIEQLTV